MNIPVKFKLDTLLVDRKQALDMIANNDVHNEWLRFCSEEKSDKKYHIFINVLDENDHHLTYALLDEDTKLDKKAFNIPSKPEPNAMGENVKKRLREFEKEIDSLVAEIRCIRNDD